MSSNYLRRMLSGLALTGLFVVQGCGGGGGTDPTPVTQPPVVVPAPVGTINGLVLTSDTSSPIANATVTVGALSTKTGADGSFSIDKVPAADRAVIKLEASGFADGLAVVAVTADQTARASARLMRAAASITIDPAANSSVTASGSSARVALSANSLVNAATGAAVTGLVTASVTPIDPAADPQSMPGDYTTNNTVSGTTNPERIESFGAIKVSLKDASGAKLNLKAGSTATIRVPLASRSVNPPASIPLFYLDEATGRWVQEGSATLAGTAPNRYYEGSVTHFSFWNADVIQDTIYVTGCVKDAAGLPPSAAVVSSTGIDYSGSADATTKADGSFRVAIRKASRAKVFAESSTGLNSDSVTVGPSNFDITLPTCLVLNAAAPAPTILTPPASISVPSGSYAYFLVSASGSKLLKYQWRRNGVDIPGATYEWLFLNAVTAADSGAKYSVVVSNVVGSVTSAEAVLTLLPPAVLTAPVFSLQPVAQSAVSGSTITLTALANGVPAPTYQWKRGTTDIAGATSASYTTPALTVADSGLQYSVVASNSQGSVSSAAVVLTVTLPPVTQTAPAFTQQPTSVTASLGSLVTFTALATGLPAPTYQWRKGGTNIAGATSASYTTPAVTLADDGAQYSVVATNSLGSITSTAASLSVTQSTTDQKVALVRLMTMAFDFFEAATLPFELTTDGDLVKFLSPATVCSSGSISGSFNGGALPAANQLVPLNGTLAATASDCLISGTVYSGSSSVVYGLTSTKPNNGSGTATVSSVRLRETSNVNNVVVPTRDITANGGGTAAFVGSVATNGDITNDITMTLAAGATVSNALSGRTATAVSGNLAVRTVEGPGGTATTPTLKLFRQTFNNLAFQVAGVTYTATGSYQFDLSNSVVGSGSAILTSNGVEVGRIRATAAGLLEIVVDGVAVPLKAPKNAEAIR
jgi:Carboxypeptidase regulatory-like domain/Immunoglobulin I-set domain